jgi:hypothetical protein
MCGEGGEGTGENPEEKDRNKNWTSLEIMTVVHTGLDTNEKMSTGQGHISTLIC